MRHELKVINFCKPWAPLACVHNDESLLQDAFKERVTYRYSQKRSNEFETKSGFYTDAMMETELKYDEQLACIRNQ